MLEKKHQLGNINTNQYYGNPHQIGFLCFKECRCKKGCDSMFLPGDPRGVMCKEWCRAKKPAVDTPPAKSYFQVSQDEINLSQQNQQRRTEAWTGVATGILNTAGNIATGFLGGGNNSSQAAAAAAAEAQARAAALEAQLAAKEEKEKSWIQKNGAIVAIGGSITLVGAVVAIVATRKK